MKKIALFVFNGERLLSIVRKNVSQGLTQGADILQKGLSFSLPGPRQVDPPDFMD